MNARHHGETAGLIFAGLYALNGAFVPAVARLTSVQADPLLVATVTCLFAAVCALVVLVARGELGVLIARDTGPRLALVGALGTAVAFVLVYAGTSADGVAVSLRSFIRPLLSSPQIPEPLDESLREGISFAGSTNQSFITRKPGRRS
jgi:drug/metabolite transporter (DMT)-like permease